MTTAAVVDLLHLTGAKTKTGTMPAITNLFFQANFGNLSLFDFELDALSHTHKFKVITENLRIMID